MALSSIALQIGIDGVPKVTAGLNDVGEAAEKVARKTESATSQMAAGWERLQSQLAQYASIAGLTLFTKQVLDAGLAFERLESVMKISTGSVSAAAREIQFIREESNRLALDSRATEAAYSKFLTAIKGTAVEGEAGRKVFIGLSEAMSALKKSPEDASRVFFQIQQSFSKGKLQLEDLNIVAEAGVPIFGLLADSLNKPRSVIMKMISDGKLLADEVWPQVAERMHSTFGQAAVDNANSAQGAINRFKNSYNQVLEMGAREFLPGFTTFLNSARTGIIPVIAELQRLGMLVDKAGGTLTAFGAIGAKVAELLVRFATVGQFGDSFKSMSDKFSKWNKMYEDRYKQGEKKLEELAMREAGISPISSQKTAAELAAEKQANDASKKLEQQAAAKLASAEAAKKYAENLKSALAGLDSQLIKSNPNLDRFDQQILELQRKLKDSKVFGNSQVQEKYKMVVANIREEQRVVAVLKEQEEANKALDAALQKEIAASKELNKQHKESVKLEQERLSALRQVQDLQSSNAAFTASQVGSNPQTGQITDPLANTTAIADQQLQAALERIDIEYNAWEKLQRDKPALAAEAALAMSALEEKAANEAIKNSQIIAKAQKDSLGRGYDQLADMASKTFPKITGFAKVSAIAQRQYDRDVSKSNQDMNGKIIDKDKLSAKGKMQLASDVTSFIGGTLTDIANMQDTTSRSGFETAKAMQMSATVVNTAAAVMNAMANVPPPMNLGVAAATAAMGAMQLATIASTSFGGGGGGVASIASGYSGTSSMSTGGGTLGSERGAQIVVATDKTSQEELKRIAGSMDNASIAITKVADHLTDITTLFTSGTLLSKLGAALQQPSNISKSGTWWSNGGSDTTLPGFLYSIGSSAVKNASDIASNIFDKGINNILKGDISGVIKNIGSVGQSTINFGKDVINTLGNLVTFGLGGSVFGGKVSGQGTGIELGLSGQNLSARNYQGYKKDGGWFSSDSYWTNYQDNPQLRYSLQGAVDKIYSTINHAVVALGTSVDTSKVKLAPEAINLGGKSADDINKILEGYLTKAANTIAANIKGLEGYAAAGESTFETVVRLSTSLQAVNSELQQTNGLMLDASLKNADLAYRFVDAFGGIDKFSEAMDNFKSALYTDAEQTKMAITKATTDVNAVFNELGLSVPTTKETFLKLTSSINTTSESGLALYASLVQIAPAFGDMIDKTKELNDAVKAFNDDIQVRTLRAQGLNNSADLLDLQIQQEKELADARSTGMDVLKLQKLQSLEWGEAVKKATSEVVSAVNSLATISNQITGMVDDRINILTTIKNIKTGADAMLSPQEAYFQSARIFASAGIQDLPNAASAFLAASKNYNASSVGYQQDLQTVLGVLQIASDTPATTVDRVAEQIQLWKDIKQAIVDNDPAKLEAKFNDLNNTTYWSGLNTVGAVSTSGQNIVTTTGGVTCAVNGVNATAYNVGNTTVGGINSLNVGVSNMDSNVNSNLSSTNSNLVKLDGTTDTYGSQNYWALSSGLGANGSIAYSINSGVGPYGAVAGKLVILNSTTGGVTTALTGTTGVVGTLNTQLNSSTGLNGRLVTLNTTTGGVTTALTGTNGVSDKFGTNLSTYMSKYMGTGSLISDVKSNTGTSNDRLAPNNESVYSAIINSLGSNGLLTGLIRSWLKVSTAELIASATKQYNDQKTIYTNESARLAGLYTSGSATAAQFASGMSPVWASYNSAYQGAVSAGATGLVAPPPSVPTVTPGMTVMHDDNYMKTMAQKIVSNGNFDANHYNSLLDVGPLVNWNITKDGRLGLDDLIIWSNLAQGGFKWSQILNHPAIYDSVPIADGVATFGIPVKNAGFATGSAYIPHDMTADIHQGEKIIDPQSSAILNRYGIKVNTEGSSDGKVVSLLDRIEKRLQKLENTTEAGVRVNQAGFIGVHTRQEQGNKDLSGLNSGKRLERMAA